MSPETFNLGSDITLVYGANGTGKSSFCEARETAMLGYFSEAQAVKRGVLARLRHQRFFSLNELNRSLSTLLTDLNQPFKELPGSRASAFAAMDQPALRALPEQ